MPESVHLCDFPAADARARDAELETQMALVQTVVRLGRQLRTEHDLKVRQPLGTLHVVSGKANVLRQVKAFEALATDELNVKRVAYGSDETALANIQVKADFRKLGPRFGQKMKAAAAAIAALPASQTALLAAGQAVTFDLAGETVALEPGDVALQRTPREGLVVAAEGDVIVALETALTPELVAEGLAREFVSKVQGLRRDADFEVTQRIHLTVATDAAVRVAVESFRDYVLAETLCTGLTFADAAADGTTIDLNSHTCHIGVAKA
jgi:isoleucyl-tRNA synthetase